MPRAWASRSRSTPFALRLVQAKVDSLGLVEDEVVGLDTQTPATGCVLQEKLTNKQTNKHIFLAHIIRVGWFPAVFPVLSGGLGASASS